MALFSDKKRVVVSVLITLIALAILTLIGWLFWQYRTTSKKLAMLQDPNQASTVEVEELVRIVNELIILPEEEPTIATITDKTKLENQEFFAKAENGDKVLIFANAKRAYLFRPSTQKIIDVAAFNLSDQSTQ